MESLKTATFGSVLKPNTKKKEVTDGMRRSIANMFATDAPGYCPDISSNPDHWTSTKEELLRRAFQK